MNDEDIDTNVSNYSLSELMTILNIDTINNDNVINSTNYYINKYKQKNPKLSNFFKEIQSQLLHYSNDLEEREDEYDYEYEENKIIVEPRKKERKQEERKQENKNIEGFTNRKNDAIYPAGEKQITNWFENQYLTQKDKTQTSKITDRKQKIQIFGNENVPMNREQIATTDTYNLPVKQDSLNPNLKNTIKRFINLDSQFRQYTSTSSSSSCDYTCDLSDTIKNALSLSLYSYQIPYSWYTIDTAYGNTCFWIFDTSNNQNINVSISVGNYNQEEFIKELNDAFTTSGFSFASNPVTYNKNSGILTMNLYGGSYTDPSGENPSFNIDETTQIIFYDFNGYLQCNVNCVSKSNHYFNSTLGWIMGYRLPYENINKNGNIASAILDLNGTKYLILAIDDYNQNHVNNSLVSISQFSNTLKIPSYYSTDLPNVCINQKSNLNSLVTQVQLEAVFDNTTQNGLLIAGKYENDYTSTEIVLPSAPRTLTNAQLYTINSINSNNNNLTNYLAKAPTSSDILAIIPVKTSVGVPTGSLLVEFSGSLQDSERIYFGPVNIERMAIKLLNDKGNVVNLNGNDWCVSLIAECLYQY
jgi:hypothetical protein